MRRRIIWICAFIPLSLSGCFYSESDFVRVEPGKRTSLGWVIVEAAEAEGFLVRVGSLTYRRIIEPYMVDDEITFESAVSAFAAFAEKQVLQRGYCESAFVPERARKLHGSHAPPEMHIYVECRR